MNIIIGNKLRNMRKWKNISQEEVADYLNISQSAYSRIEKGETGSWLNSIDRICDFFEIKPEELLKCEEVSEKFKSSNELIEYYELKIKELQNVINEKK